MKKVFNKDVKKTKKNNDVLKPMEMRGKIE